MERRYFIMSIINRQLKTNQDLIRVPMIFIVKRRITSNTFRRLMGALLHHSASRRIRPILVVSLPIVDRRILPRPNRITIPNFKRTINFILLYFQGMMFQRRITTTSISMISTRTNFGIGPIRSVPIRRNTTRSAFFPIIVIYVVRYNSKVNEENTFKVRGAPIFVMKALRKASNVNDFRRHTIFILLVTRENQRVIPRNRPFTSLMTVINARNRTIMNISNSSTILLMVSDTRIMTRLLQSTTSTRLVITCKDRAGSFIRPINSFTR